MPIKNSHKNKQLFSMLIKLSIVASAIYFIYQKLINNSPLSFYDFSVYLFKNHVFSIKNTFFLFFLTFINWFLVFFKWKILTSPIKKITFLNAIEQSLGSLTASLITPNRIGEYGAKALYYKKENRKHIMLINLLSNLLQMTATLSFGFIGFSFFTTKYNVTLNYFKLVPVLILAVLVISILYFILRKSRKLYYYRFKNFIINFPKKKILHSTAISLFRYLIFSFQFYYLLTLFDIEIQYLNAMSVITSMYLLASLTPSLAIFDVAIKGSIAVYLFSFLNISALIILSITTIMWVLNFMLPSILGSFYILRFSLPKETN